MKIGFYLLLLLPFLGVAQVEPKEQDSTETVMYYYVPGDSIAKTVIELDEVVLLSKLRFSDKDARIKYLILRRKTLKVYPYAKLAAERLTTLNERLESMEKKSDQRKYMRIVQKYIEEEFSAELKKLTRTEGQILIKLIHRQTGHTTFALIKELKSGWRAFWFNNTAKLFDINLKREFDPYNVQEDYLIEDILQRAFQAGQLEKQKPAFKIDLAELSRKWKVSNVTGN